MGNLSKTTELYVVDGKPAFVKGATFYVLGWPEGPFDASSRT